jgi:ankyrin repeat protein
VQVDRDEAKALGLGDWHLCVLLDTSQCLSSLDPQVLNERNVAGDTPLDLAYRLGRRELMGKLQALGAQGELQFRDWPGLGTFMPHDQYIHQPARQGNVKTLEARYRLGGSLNDRDALGNTPLHWLVINGHLKAVKYFAERYRSFGLDLNAKNHQGETARNIALGNGFHETAQQLLTAEVDNCIGALRIWREMGLNHA